ncbi:unnamed protein product [Lymnaea stagnalis]|uniref:RRM domain-containing protein n=1 Tax=Lymnaea stagnalis TaxID=6523 RepID=A0AAV2HKM2_LYMST
MGPRSILVVRNISWASLKSELRKYFNKFGTVHEIRLPMNYETGFNRNIAFVVMSGKEKYLNSILEDYHVIDGKEVIVELQAERSNQVDNQPS